MIENFLEKYKIKKEVIYKIEDTELDNLISDYYGVNYEVVPYEELSNGEDKEFKVVFSDKPSAWSKNALEAGSLLMDTKKIKHFTTEKYLTYMAMQGMIPEGNYLISLFW